MGKIDREPRKMKLTKHMLRKLIKEAMEDLGPAAEAFNLHDYETKLAFVKFYQQLLEEYGSDDNPRFKEVEEGLTKIGRILDSMNPEVRKWIFAYFGMMKFHEKFKEE